MKKNIFIFLILTIILSSAVHATFYITQNHTLYRAYDNVAFSPIIYYQYHPNAQQPCVSCVFEDIRELNTDITGANIIFIDGNQSDAVAQFNRTITYSRNYGESWNLYPSFTGAWRTRWLDIGANPNMSTVAVITGSNIFISHNFDDVGSVISFTNISVASTSLTDVAVSEDGRIVVVAENVGAGGIWVSTNSGASFAKQMVSAGAVYMQVCASDGIIYGIKVASGNTRISFDNGTTSAPVGLAPTSNTRGESLCYNNNIIMNGFNEIGAMRSSNNSYNGTLQVSQPSNINCTDITTLANLSQVFCSNDTKILASTNLTQFTLYQSGFVNLGEIAISRDTFVTVPNQPICIDDTTYCGDAQFNFATGTYQCFLNETQHCSDGCSNSTGTPVCSNSCTNTCNILGARQCTSSTAYANCQDSNGDGCYEYSGGAQCGVGNYCQSQGFFFAFCTAVPSQGLGSNTVFNVIPYAVNDNETSYAVDSNTRTVSASTVNTFHVQKFYTQANNGTYSSRTCSYSEQNQYTMVTVQQINDTAFNFGTSVGTTSYVLVNLLPNNEAPILINIYDALGTNMYAVNVTRNISEKSVTLRMLNGSIIYKDLSQNSFDDLTALELTFTFDFVSGTKSLKARFDRVQDNTISTTVELFAGNDLTNIVFNTTNATLNGIAVNTFTQPSGFVYNDATDENMLPCTYINIGTYKVRTYNNANGQPDYNNYVDYTVNVRALGLTQGELEQEQSSDGLSTQSKYIIGTMIIISLFLLFAIVTFALMRDGTVAVLSGFVGMFIGIIVSGALGYIPIWILLMIAIIDGLIVAMIFKKLFLSASAG